MSSKKTNMTINEIKIKLENFQDLIYEPTEAILSTFSSDGYPHVTVVWFDFDGTYFRINTMKEFQKHKNIRNNPLVNLMIYDKHNTNRSIEIRGRVIEMNEDQAMKHLDNLSVKYIGRGPYFGECIPKHYEEIQNPVLCKIEPFKIVTQSIKRRNNE